MEMQLQEDNENPHNQQAQQGFIMRNYKNIGLLILLCLFILFIVMIFYLFIYLIYAAEDEGETTYQYKVTQYQTTNVSITMIAECIECKIYYVNKNNYVAMALNITILFLSKQSHSLLI